MIRRVTVALGLSVGVISAASAYVDHVPEWDRIEISATVDGEKIRVIAQADAERLVLVAFVVRGKQISVPQDHLGGIAKPRLRTIRVVSPDVKFAPGPTFFVAFQFGPDSKLGSKVKPHVVSYDFGQLKYMGRLIERELEGGVSEREVWEPGKAPRRERDAQQHVAPDTQKPRAGERGR